MKMFKLLLSLLLISLFFLSCSKEYITIDEYKGEENSLINIRTRASGTDAVISYPVHVYVFDSNEKCVSTATIEDEGSQLSLPLLEGMYKVYAVAGVDIANYEIPTKDDATPSTVVRLLDGKKHGDLMTANNTVVLREGDENTLTLTLERRVMLLQDFVIYNVPSKVSEVSVTIAPFYENICVDGTMSGTNGVHTKTLTKTSGSKTWTNSQEEYLLENAGNVTITVTMKYPDQTKSYSYTYPDKFLANYKIKIYGAYTETLGVTLNGTITGATWAGEKEISFSFDENGSYDGTGSDITPDDPTGGDDGDEDDTPVVGDQTDLPQVGTFYKGCYVMKHENAGGKTVVTLISGTAKQNLSFTKGDQSSIKSAVNDALASWDVEGVTGWRLPNEDEVAFIRENATVINENCISAGKGYIYVSGSFYIYETADGNIMSFTVRDDLPAGWSSNCSTSDYLRPVTKITFE